MNFQGVLHPLRNYQYISELLIISELIRLQLILRNEKCEKEQEWWGTLFPALKAACIWRMGKEGKTFDMV